MVRDELRERADVLVLAPNARDYRPFIDEKASPGARVTYAHTVDEALAAGGMFPVILGQPDQVAEFLEHRPAAAWVQSTWAGVTPLLATGRKDFLLTGVRDTFGPQIAEYVLGYLLARELKLLERLGRQASRDWWPQPGGTLAGKTMGVMGTGSIGACLAGMAAPFGLRLIGLNRRGAEADGFERIFAVSELTAFLAEPDYLVCTLPQTAETEGLLNAETLRAVKPGCCLVNVGRGSVIDEAALLDALEDGTLAGAVLDVFREEPLPPESPLWHAPETLVTAHVAAKSHPADIAKIFLENLRRFRDGQALKYRIDFDRGY